MISFLRVSLIISLIMLHQCTFEGPSINGFVYGDQNQNGQYDPGEPGLPGVEVDLLDKDGNVAGSSMTDRGGFYEFSKFEPGEYTIRVHAPDGYTFANSGPFEDTVIYVENRGNYEVHSIGINPLVAGSNPPLQGTVTLNPSEDTVVTGNGTEANFGDLDNFWLDDESSVFMRFPLNGLPQYYTVESVILSLFMDGSGYAGGETIAITFPEQSSLWSEMGLTWNNKPAQAPEALVIYPQMADYTGAGSVDIFDLTDLFRDFQQMFPEKPSFDMMFFYSQPGHPSQGWYSREGQNPPQLNLNYYYLP